MGQGCCYPSRDANQDLRGTNRSKKKGDKNLEENTFHRPLEGRHPTHPCSLC